MTMLSVRREVGEFKKRYKWMALFVFVCFGAVLARLVYLQLVTHEHWAGQAKANITKRVRLHATRGIIRDRVGRVLADNRPAYSVFMTPQLLDKNSIALIAKLMDLDDDERRALQAKIDAVPTRRRAHFIEMLSDITRDQYAALETHNRELPGVHAVVEPVRTYPFKRLAAHTVGFLNEVSAEDIERLQGQGYRAGSRIGRSGVERAWESYVRGQDGELKVVVDVRGKEFNPAGARLRKTVVRTEPTPGRDLRLTLDMGIMRSIERAFRGHPSGAAVVVDVRTGYVRAMFSKPSYDLNEMSGRLSPERADEIQQDPFRPLIDKTIYESYFPGSTFKAISALAALQDDLIEGTNRYDCNGFYELGNRKFRCGHVHGEIDMRTAIVQSCNVYFYRLGQTIGLDRLSQFARDFGLGERTGIGINTEASGFVPTRDWYKKRHGNQYRLGFTLNAAIGQGNTRVTLVQLAMAYAAIANGGTLYVPQLVQAIEAPDGTTVERFEPHVRRRVSVDPRHLTYVIDGMFGVVNDPNGTAFDARIDGGVPAAGKTGTAQVSKRQLRPGEDPRRAWYYRRSHAWFAGFAPADNPELAIVVLVEHGGDGGKYAGPIAMQVLQDALGAEQPQKGSGETAEADSRTKSKKTKRKRGRRPARKPAADATASPDDDTAKAN